MEARLSRTFRLSAESIRALRRLSEHMHLTKTEVVELALRILARREGTDA